MIGAAREPGPSTPERPLVVLAEDDADTRRMLREALVLAGYEVVEMVDGQELMSLVSTSSSDELAPPDFIVADVRMPHFTGLEALYAIQRSVLFAPVILMSAFCDEATQWLARRGGAAALLEKPLDPDRLVSTLAAVRSGLA